MIGKRWGRLGIAAGMAMLALALCGNLLKAQNQNKNDTKYIHILVYDDVHIQKVGDYDITTLTNGVVTQEDATFKANLMVIKIERQSQRDYLYRQPGVHRYGESHHRR